MLRGIFGSGGGAAVGGSGTTNTIPRWTGPSTLGDSVITQNSTALVTTGSSSATQTTFRVRTVGTANNAPVFSLYREGVNEQVIWAGSGTIRFGFATDPAGYTDAQLLAATKMGIDASGNVGIGTASPGAILHTLGTGTTTGIFATSSANAWMELRRSTSTTLGYIGTGSGLVTGGAAADLAFRCESGNLLFSTVATERARIDSAGNLILNTANTGATIQAAGTSQGLKLQGTAGTNNTDPNVLDFYADGGTANSGGVAWTPTLKFGGNTTGITYNTQMGRYTRIGNMVFASCYIRLTSKGTATGAATIDGLPTCVNLAGFYAAGAIGYTAAITSTGTMQINMLANQTQLTIRQVTAVGVNTAVTDTDFANGSEIIVSISYPVN